MQPSKKETLLFVCGQCSFESRKWLGRCPDCGAWDSLTEEKKQISVRHGRTTATAQPLAASGEEECARLVTSIGEMDRVLGGGIVPGSLSLHQEGRRLQGGTFFCACKLRKPLATQTV